MSFFNISHILSTIHIPSEVLYPTCLLDSDQVSSVAIELYDKLLLVSSVSTQKDISGFDFKLDVKNKEYTVSLYEKPDLVCDVTFVLQGLPHEYTPLAVVYTAPYGSISLGLWDSDFELVKTYQETQNIDNFYNKYFQIASTLKGLINVQTPYAVKLRADEYYVNFIPFLKRLKTIQPLQIITSNIFFKKAYEWPYHISDHIIAGRTECLLTMFQRARISAEERTLLNITPEVHLAVSYLQHFSNVSHLDSDFKKVHSLMHRFFDIYSIYLFEQYKVKAGGYMTKEDGRVCGINTLDAISEFCVCDSPPLEMNV